MSYAFSEITALIKFWGFSGLPIRNSFKSDFSFVLTSGHMFEGIYALDAAEHFWPWYSNAPLEIAVATS